jgi:hypothetical protein
MNSDRTIAGVADGARRATAPEPAAAAAAAASTVSQPDRLMRRGSVSLPLMTRMRATAVLLGGLFAPSCGTSSATPEPPAPPIIRPIQIDSAQPRVNGAQVSIDIRGVIGDGCSELYGGAFVRRAEASVEIQILGQRPADAICPQIAKLYAETLRIPDAFAPGHYTLRVNAFETTFDVP